MLFINSSTPKIYSFQANLTKNSIKSIEKSFLRTSTTTTSSSTSTTTISTSTSTLNTTITLSSSTTVNFDAILCDNISESKNLNISKTPCERIRCAVLLRSSGGRLGNRMFMFASAYGLARTHNCRLHVSSAILNELSANFQMESVAQKMWLSDSEAKTLKDIVVKNTACTFIPELLRPNAFNMIEIRGYWQSYLYFDAYREEIREFFTGKNETLVRIADYLNNMTEPICPSCLPLPDTTHKELRQAFQTRFNTTWIGIHIRRRDFVGLGYASDDNYIRRAITYFRRRYHHQPIRFLVGSDDKSYCDKLFTSEIRLEKVFILPKQSSTSDDMLVLSLCHHSIVTGGTYSFWTAYLTGGDVIHDIRYQAVCSRSDYYPPWFMLVGQTVEKKP